MSNSHCIALPMSREEIYKITKETRTALRLENKMKFPVIDFFEKTLFNLIDNYNFIIKSEAEMGIKEGETFPEQKLITIREDVYINACNNEGRARMTIAHEIGHLFLHTNNNLSFARSDNNCYKRYLDPEWQAKVFAGELLIPKDLIIGLSPMDIMNNCGVSYEAAKLHHDIIKKINP
ncbi:MAG: hypothetical protein A2355_18480 [Spirochaetes bacterium RIFOXYB1_FULL_32_8]|nr:MAG: hypothetical protein A2355_18480 [Spirochaetes bacterium RIFOXYB1_FULL_32_8]